MLKCVTVLATLVRNASQEQYSMFGAGRSFSSLCQDSGFGLRPFMIHYFEVPYFNFLLDCFLLHCFTTIFNSIQYCCTVLKMLFVTL